MKVSKKKIRKKNKQKNILKQKLKVIKRKNENEFIQSVKKKWI